MSEIAVPDSVKVWKIGVDAANVMSWNNYTNNQGYHLFCMTNGKFLTHEKMTFGVNLGFKGAGDNKTHFRLPDNQERQILSGESIALGIGGKPSFLRYKSRDVGINLDWSETPVFEWRIMGPELGQPIPENTPVAIINDKVTPDPDFLIYFKRVAGTDIGWTSSPGFWDHFVSVAEKVAVKAAKEYVKSQL
jgi:hypothetical protein